MRGRKEYNYFDAFVNLSRFSLNSAETLNKTLHEFDIRKIEDKILEMHNIEHLADVARHEMLQNLMKEFLPPIEREDINILSQKIDDVTDSIEDVLICINIFNVKNIRPEILKFTKLIVSCCKAMDLALSEFKNFKKSKKLHSQIVEINRLEEEGDVLYAKGVRNLYKNIKEPVELMVWTDIFCRLEKCCDACEEVANTIESTIMKNS